MCCDDQFNTCCLAEHQSIVCRLMLPSVIFVVHVTVWSCMVGDSVRCLHAVTRKLSACINH